MKTAKLFSWVVSGVLLFLVCGDVLAAAPFYEGKNIRFIVGASAGGGYDSYARVLSRHMGRYLPGKPGIIVENMTGAGTLISANYLYKIAKPDGLTIGSFNGGLLFNQLFDLPGFEFDGRKFEFIGAMVTEDPAYAFTKASGITSIEKWMASKTPLKMGGVGPGGYTPDNVIRITKTALGLPIHYVTGYKGTAEIRLACESGELDGTVFGWYSMRSTWRKALETGDVVVVLQGMKKPMPELPKVPLAISLAKTDEARQMVEVGIHSPGTFARPFVLPPATPKETVQMLRKALIETMKDKEFLVEMEKAKLDLNPVSGEDLEKAVREVHRLDAGLVAKLKDALFKK